MALIEQWRSKRSIVVDGLVALAGGTFGLGALIPGAWFLLQPKALFQRHERIGKIQFDLESCQLLIALQGFIFRELQRRLDAANGTLRHHLDVLIAEKSVTTMSVNGRTCYYAGAPAQVEILIGTGVTDDERAASMLPVGLSELQQAVVARLTRSDVPPLKLH